MAIRRKRSRPKGRCAPGQIARRRPPQWRRGRRGRGGPQLGQARGAVVLVLLAEVLVLLRSAPLFPRAFRRGGALLGLRIVGPGAGRVLEDAAKGLRAVVRLVGRGDAEVDE